jgi:phosphomannomutase
MTLIKSISGIRGTIGGPAGDTLNPLDIVKFTSAYATFIRRSGASESNTIVVGRDARISGEMVKNVVCGTLMGMGYDVLNIGLATTPTTDNSVNILHLGSYIHLAYSSCGVLATMLLGNITEGTGR